MLKRILTLTRYRREVRMVLSSCLRIAGGDENAMILGGLTEEEIHGLISWLPEHGTLIEFGTLFGLTAKAIAAAKPNLKIVAVDNFSWNPFGLPPELHEAFTRRILSNEITVGQIEVVNADSEGFRADCKIVPDAVFFDALHQYEPVKTEIEWAKRIGVRCITGHDYNNPSKVFGVTKAVDEAFGKPSEVIGMCWKA